MNNIARAAFVFLIIVYTSGVIGMWLRPQMFIPYTPAVLLMFALYFIYVHRRLSADFFGIGRYGGFKLCYRSIRRYNRLGFWNIPLRYGIWTKSRRRTFMHKP